MSNQHHYHPPQHRELTKWEKNHPHLYVYRWNEKKARTLHLKAHRPICLYLK